MSNYALVENGAVTYIGDIPTKFKNVTAFDKIKDDAIYKTYGFYPYEYIQPDFDILTQRLGDTLMLIEENKVTGTRQILPKNPDEISGAKAGIYQNCLKSLKDLLFATDWVHTPDSGLSAEQLAAYVGLRASIHSALTNQSGSDSTIAQVDSLRAKIDACTLKGRERNNVMCNAFIALKTALDAL